MEQQNKQTEASPLCSSRLKLGWLVLLTCTGLVLYSYFDFYSTASPLFFIHRHMQTTRDAVGGRAGTLSDSVATTSTRAASTTAVIETTSAHQITTNSFSTNGDKVDTRKDNLYTLKLSTTYTESRNALDQSGTNELGESLASESNNEDEIEAFIKEISNEDDREGNFESDYIFDEEFENASYYVETTDGPNVGSVSYETSGGEFGVVFADQDPSSEDEEEEELDETLGDEREERERNDQKTELSSDASAMYYQVKDVPSISGNDAESVMPHLKSAKEVYGETLLEHIHRHTNHSDPQCSVSSLFHSWENGMVTQMSTPLKRDCHKLSLNPSREVKRSKLKSQVKKWKSKKPWETLALKYKGMSCTDMRQDFENNFYVSQLEKEFPIAYIFVVYTNAGQVLRLLKSIYRPHNLYCIHPDARQGEAFASFFKAVAKCLDNVFVVSKPVKVYYGHISITNAQLHCMQDLVQYPETRWKYVINLCGREIPLKTNREIVESLRKLKGYTALNLRNLRPIFWTQRFRYKYRLNYKGSIRPTRKRQSKPPKGIKLYKSMNFIAASRAFVYFILHDPLSSKLHKFLNSVYAPEEHFYSSLYALKQAKGARPPKGLLPRNTIPTVDGFIWVNSLWEVAHSKKFCPGHHVVHGICILTAGDLARIAKLGVHSKRPVFFFNKYFLEWDPTPMDCMEERLVKANMDEYRRDCLTGNHKHT